jgi:hypothetical protein
LVFEKAEGYVTMIKTRRRYEIIPGRCCFILKLYHSLFIHFNNKKNILKGLNDPDDKKKFPFQEFYKIRDQLTEGKTNELSSHKI